MRKHLIFLFYFFIFSNLSAEILRVNSDPGKMAPYTSMQSAHDAASVGDTLLIEGASYEYSNLTSNKQIAILGSGMSLSNNSNQFSGKSTFLNYLTIGDSTTISGVVLGRATATNGSNTFYGSNIILKNSYNKVSLTIKGINTRIFHSWLQGELNVRDNTGDPDSLIVYNCRVGLFENQTNSSAIFFNNVIVNLSNVNFTHFYNNIIENINLDDLDNSHDYVFKYNIFGCPCPEGSNLDHPNLHNIFDVDLSTVFTYGAGDRYYELIPGSVAEGAGLEGVDCGMFGGLTPYALGGMPPEIPAVSDFEVNRSNMTPDDLNIIFEAKTHPRPYLQP